MRVLILNRPGFIGTHLINCLCDHEVAVLTSADIPSFNGRIFLGARSDLLRPKLQTCLSRWKPDVVIDMGAFNQKTAMQALEGLKGITSRFVMVSSISVYGRYGTFLRLEPRRRNGAAFLRESDPLRRRLFVYRQLSGRSSDPKRPWLAQYEKILAEATYRSACNVNVRVVRLPMIYGPGDPDKRVQYYVNLLREGPVVMTRQQAAWRQSRCFVRDTAKAIAKAAVYDGDGPAFDIINISDGLDLTEADWVARIAAAMGPLNHPACVESTKEVQPLVSDFPLECDYTQHLAVDNQRIRLVFGWQAETKLEMALAETIQMNCDA